MKYVTILILFSVVACAPSRPIFYGTNKTDNFARKIDYTKGFYIQPQWSEVLKRQPVISGNRTVIYADLVAVQALCNTFKWAHKDEKLSTPQEAQLKGWGDCKDAAICKYYKLRAIGAKPEQLNLWQGWYGDKYAGHLTLAVRIGDKQYILDDMSDIIIEAKLYMHKDFEPYARFNEIGWSLD
jgi:hypothetical protein